MKKILVFTIIILLALTHICQAQNEPYIRGDIEPAIYNELNNFFNAMNFDSLLISNESAERSILNKKYIDYLIEQKGMGELYITSSIFPKNLPSLNKESIAFTQLLDTIEQWFPTCQDPNFTSDADYLLNLGGDGKADFMWKEKELNSPKNSFYFQNKLYINVGIGLFFNCDYFNKYDNQCFIPIEPASGSSSTIPVSDIQWQKDATGTEFFFKDKLHRNIVLTSISNAYKPYISSTDKADTITMIVNSGRIFKSSITGDSITITDSSVFVNPNPVTIRSYNYSGEKFYFSFIVDLPDLKNWKAERITPRLVKISKNIPDIMEIVIGPTAKYKNKFHIAVSAGTNFTQWNGSQLPEGSNGSIENNIFSPGIDLMLNYRIKEKPYGVTFGVKAGIGIQNYTTLLNNFKYENNTDYSGTNGLGNFTWNYSAQIDQLKTTIQTIEPSILLGVVYKPSLRGQSLNMDIDFAVGYKYSSIINEQVESTGMNASITTKGQFTDFPVLLENEPEYNFSTYENELITTNITSPLSRSFSSIIFSFQPSLRLRERISLFLNFTYAYGLTNMASTEFNYVDQSTDGNILFGNPIYNSMGNKLTISSMRLSFGVSIPLSN